MRGRTMKLQHRSGLAVATVSAVTLLAGGGAYAVTQAADPAVNRSAELSARSASAPAMMSGQGMGMGRFTEEQPFDAQFLDQMAVHHQGAVMSTQAMISDSARPELRALAEDIITSQRKQLTQMQAWRTQWYPDLAPTFGMTGGMMGGTEGHGSMMGRAGGDPMMDSSMMSGSMMESMMSGAAGTERMYLQMMIIHHQLAVDMAEKAQAQATHPQLKDLAATIAEEQAAQIVQMRGYLADSPDPTRD